MRAGIRLIEEKVGAGAEATREKTVIINLRTLAAEGQSS